MFCRPSNQRIHDLEEENARLRASSHSSTNSTVRSGNVEAKVGSQDAVVATDANNLRSPATWTSDSICREAARDPWTSHKNALFGETARQSTYTSPLLIAGPAISLTRSRAARIHPSEVRQARLWGHRPSDWFSTALCILEPTMRRNCRLPNSVHARHGHWWPILLAPAVERHLIRCDEAYTSDSKALPVHR